MSKNTTTVHPGELLMDELNTRGLKKMAFARKMQISNSFFSDIIHGKKEMTEAVAQKLEELLGIPADDWMSAQRNYNYYYEPMPALKMRS